MITGEKFTFDMLRDHNLWSVKVRQKAFIAI